MVNMKLTKQQTKEISKKHTPENFLPKPGRPLPGSITVETALILPVFLFAMLSVMYLIDAIRISSENTEMLAEKACLYAKYAYIGDSISDGTAVSDAIDMINGGDDIIDLVKRYRIDVPFDLSGAYDPFAIDRVRVRAFTGYDNSKHCHGHDDAPEEMVYVTEYGSVYHRSLGCSHLNLNVRSVAYDSISNERSNDGSRYYACEYCCPHGAKPASVYITDDGNRYHSTLSCGALKRTVNEVALSQTSLPACKECGG